MVLPKTTKLLQSFFNAVILISGRQKGRKTLSGWCVISKREIIHYFFLLIVKDLLEPILIVIFSLF